LLTILASVHPVTIVREKGGFVATDSSSDRVTQPQGFCSFRQKTVRLTAKEYQLPPNIEGKFTKSAKPTYEY
jgi:hypothetical protein